MTGVAVLAPRTTAAGAVRGGDAGAEPGAYQNCSRFDVEGWMNRQFEISTL